MSKFILVPSPLRFNKAQVAMRNGTVNLHDFNVVIPPISTGVVTQSGEVLPISVPATTAQVHPGYSGYSSVDYDPLYEYLDWYAEGKQHFFKMMSVDEFKTKVWKKTEISDWIEVNCESVVVARMGHNTVDLVFTSQIDYFNFNTWWMMLRKSFFIDIQVSETKSAYILEQDVLNWCKLNLTREYDIQRWGNSIQLYVKDSNDAVMAKLYWSGSRD